MSGNESDHGRLSRALRASEARLTALVESLPFDLWIIGSDGRYTMQNGVCREIWGDVVGRRPDEVAGDPRTAELWLANNRRAFGGETVKEEVQFPARGELRHFYNIVTPIVADGQTIGILGVNLDITERRQAEDALRRRNEELARANRELERLGQVKDQLTAMISHELRTPLVTGLGYIDMLLEGSLGPITDAIRSRLSIAQRNLRRLAQMIEAVLRYQRLLTTNALPLTRLVQFDIARLAREVADEAARKPQIEVVADLPRVTGDRGMVRMVLVNLLDNAATHAGADANVRLVITPEPPGHVRVCVEDDGVGIPSEIRDTIFEPFVRGDEAHEGSGLGLTVVRSILRAHGGDPQIESPAGGGTRVWFSLAADDQ